MPRTDSASSQSASHSMGGAVERGLARPLRALRACLESLTGELGLPEPGNDFAQGALDEVLRLGRNAQLLCEWGEPPELMPLRCTTQEILHAARKGLPSTWHERIWVAHDTREPAVSVDGPVLARCLARLIENAFEAGSERVLLRFRDGANGCRISLVDRAPGPSLDLERARTPFHSTKPGHLGLGLSIVTRDLALLGAELDVEAVDGGGTLIAFEVPDLPVSDRADVGGAA